MMGLFTKIVNDWKLVIIFAKKFHQKFDRIINKHDSGFYFSIKILQMTLRTNGLKSFFFHIRERDERLAHYSELAGREQKKYRY